MGLGRRAYRGGSILRRRLRRRRSAAASSADENPYDRTGTDGGAEEDASLTGGTGLEIVD